MNNEETAGATGLLSGARDFVALARAICAAPVGLLRLAGGEWVGAEAVDRADLEHILSFGSARTLERASTEAQSVFFEASWDQRYCGGVVLRNGLGLLCVLDDRARAPLTDTQRDLLLALGNQLTKLSDMQRALRRLRPLGHLTRGLAHDMNNALQTIVGALNTVDKLIETDNLERTPRFMAAALRSAHRAGELTHSLQRLARREAGRATSVDVNSLISSLEDLFRRIGGERIALQIHLPDRPLVADCDPGELEETLLALVIEAAEAISDTGAIRITLRKDERSVYVCVQERCLRLPGA